MQFEVIYRGPACEKVITIGVSSNNPLKDLKDVLQEVNHIPGFAIYFKGKLLLAEELSFKQHRLKNGSELDLKHYIRIYFKDAKLLRKPIPHWVWFNETVGKVKKHLESLKNEFPDLPSEPQISFPGVDGLPDDEMTLWEYNVEHEGTICISNWEAPAPRVHDNALFLELWADAEQFPAPPPEAPQPPTFEEYAACHPDFF